MKYLAYMRRNWPRCWRPKQLSIRLSCTGTLIYGLAVSSEVCYVLSRNMGTCNLAHTFSLQDFSGILRVFLIHLVQILTSMLSCRAFQRACGSNLYTAIRIPFIHGRVLPHFIARIVGDPYFMNSLLFPTGDACGNWWRLVIADDGKIEPTISSPALSPKKALVEKQCFEACIGTVPTANPSTALICRSRFGNS